LISGLVGISQTAIDGTLTVINNDKIVGFPSDDAAAIAADTGTSIITNNGKIEGNVFLGSGNDVYNGANGTIVGTILLNGGNDLATGGAGDEVFFGGLGDDTLNGGGGSDTAVYAASAAVDIIVDLKLAGP
jgi:Ca2+-binding RTX toxin-like protein